MKAVFLDLDGTLVDSRPGILDALHAAFHQTGNGHLASEDLTWLIGPPFHESFPKLGIEKPHDVIDAYRAHYEESAMFRATVYDGIAEMMDALLASGHRLYLATAKPHVAARRITAHFGLAPKFVEEFGPELDGTRNWKGDLLTYALGRTGEVAKSSVMVGDRHHDMAAAAEVGMPSIAVRWGYGGPDEWTTAAAVADAPGEVAGLISRL